MPSKVVVDAVRARQAAGWTTLAVFYPNDVVIPAADLGSFVQVEFPVGAGDRLTLAYDRGHREAGTIRFVIHVRIKTGSDQAFTWADELADLFRSVRLLNSAEALIETDDATPPVGLGADAAYYRFSVVIPYQCFFVP